MFKVIVYLERMSSDLYLFVFFFYFSLPSPARLIHTKPHCINAVTVCKYNTQRIYRVSDEDARQRRKCARSREMHAEFGERAELGMTRVL